MTSYITPHLIAILYLVFKSIRKFRFKFYFIFISQINLVICASETGVRSKGIDLFVLDPITSSFLIVLILMLGMSSLGISHNLSRNQYSVHIVQFGL